MKPKEILSTLEALHQNTTAWSNMVKKLEPVFDHMPPNPTPDDFINAMERSGQEKSMNVEKCFGINATIDGRLVKLYPLARYEWDGGAPIFTQRFNLRPLASSSIYGGPFAEICVADHYLGCPGIAVHTVPEQGLMHIHIFE